jgi:hypothetical protein
VDKNIGGKKLLKFITKRSTISDGQWTLHCGPRTLCHPTVTQVLCSQFNCYITLYICFLFMVFINHGSVPYSIE